MGIPKFFRWLTRRYPLILQNIQREDEILPIDNLYLDLNGIVHNCVHGNDPKRHERISRLEDMEELWAAIMQAIDEIVHLVKPKKNVFLAVDGVAPRAKMNQQRARRFRSARERALLKAQIEARGKQMPDLFDSNAISPGTKFMSDLCTQLHFFIKYKLNSDPLYQNLESCVLSDGTVPGEGEHKMLDYIRQLRKKPTYDPNTRHMFYGADADLIMLSLLTHEPHFTIIREEHVVKRNKTSGGVQRVELSHTNNFQLIHISLLREYMMLEYKQLNGQLRFRFDIERIIDDFVFFCFFIGNDFLPSLSALDIAEGSLDHLIEFYKSFLPSMNDYITEAGTIHWDRAEKFIELLGQHEQQVFQGRIDTINHGSGGNRRGNDFGKRALEMQKTVTVSAEAQMLLEGDTIGGGEGQPLERVSSQVQSLYRNALYAKKVAKVHKYEIKQTGKKYKKYLITKKFREDEAGKGKQIPKKEKEALNAKLQALYQVAQAKAKDSTEEEGKSSAAESNTEETKDEAKTGLQLIEEIDESYFSDLRPEDIPDDCVSEPNMETLENDDTAADTAKSNLLTAQADIDARAEEENRKFIQEFVTIYAENPTAAKRKYYYDKVGFNIDEEAGIEKRKVMMKKYLEGLQWVLYYYYKGCTHWRWYYPFHYAPMISDLGSNIVREFLSSKTVIREFEIDFNCPTSDRPYTPFQQLLCIMPLKSIHLLPKCYEGIARGDLVEFFPEDFPIDLNGKTVAWEALVLIPFADEALFLQKESEMFRSKASGSVFSEEESTRNQTSFTFFSYKFDQNIEAKPLPSTLTNMKGLGADKTKLTLDTNYENVGTEAFAPRILAGVQLPSPGYPTFKTLGVIELKYNSVYVQKQEFKVAMVVVPQVIEETQPEELEKYLMKLTKQNKKDVFVDFPYQNEAFPMSFEDQFSVYTLFGDYYENKYTIQVGEQTRSEKEWQNHVNRIRFKLEDKGIHCPPEKVNVLASCYKVSDVNFNAEYDDQYFFKVYDDRSTILPLSLMMRVRSPDHHMSVDMRILSPDEEMRQGSQVICAKLNLYGLIGRCVNRDRRSGNFKVKFDRSKELGKVHDPFMGQKAIEAYAKANAEQVTRSQQYYGENEIDTLLQVPEGVTAAMTSSFMVKYKSPETRDRVLVDIGLNIKSWKTKQHVPGFVRFAANQTAVNAVDEIAGKNYQRAGRHVRAHWQYSVALVEILREYKEKFPEVFESALKVRKRDQMPSIKEVIGADDSNAVGRLKEITKWIESLPISSLPFVDMGFDTLETSMISSINDHRQSAEENNTVQLQVRNNEYLPSKFLYMERFPYWSSLFPENTVDKFKVGDRVINLCSTKRAYVPFGARGTCVGKSEQKVIVMYDEQFIQGSDINGQCELYRGALMDPTHLMNVTRKFENQIKKNGKRVMANIFSEEQRPVAEGEEEQPSDTTTSSSNFTNQSDKNKNSGNHSQRNQVASAQPDMEERKGGGNRGGHGQAASGGSGRGQQKQYRMKANQQQALDYQNQQQEAAEGKWQDAATRGGGRGQTGGRGGRGREIGSRGGHQQQQHPPPSTSTAAQNEPEEIPKLTFKPMSDLAELMNAVNTSGPPGQIAAAGQSLQMSSEAQPFQPGAGSTRSTGIAASMPDAVQNQQAPNSSLMSQNMVSLASPAFVPAQKPVTSNQAQGASTSNPEDEQKPTDQQQVQ